MTLKERTPTKLDIKIQKLIASESVFSRAKHMLTIKKD